MSVEAREALIRTSTNRESLIALQKRVDEALAKAGKRNRLAVMQAMLFESLDQMRRELECFRL